MGIGIGSIISLALWKQKPMQVVMGLRGLTQETEGREFFPFYAGICGTPSLTLCPALTPKSQDSCQQTGKSPVQNQTFAEKHH